MRGSEPGNFCQNPLCSVWVPRAQRETRAGRTGDIANHSEESGILEYCCGLGKLVSTTAIIGIDTKVRICTLEYVFLRISRELVS